MKKWPRQPGAAVSVVNFVAAEAESTCNRAQSARIYKSEPAEDRCNHRNLASFQFLADTPRQIPNPKGEYSDMSRRAVPILLGIVVLIAMSVSVRAKNDAGEAVTASIKLTAATSIGGTKLPAGDYKVEVEGNKAKFQQGSKVVAEVPCTVKDLNFKIATTNFVIDHDQLTEIQVAGKSKAIELGGQ